VRAKCGKYGIIITNAVDKVAFGNTLCLLQAFGSCKVKGVERGFKNIFVDFGFRVKVFFVDIFKSLCDNFGRKCKTFVGKAFNSSVVGAVIAIV
jgi:hypothetical protein